MRNMIYGMALLVAGCFSCTSSVPSSYTIEGEVKGFGDGYFYVVSETLDDYTNDTAFVKNDKFIFQSSTKHPVQLLFVVADNEECTRLGTYSFRVFAENSDTPVQVKADVGKRIENAEITGSLLQQQFEQVEATGMFKRLRRNQWLKDSLLKAADTLAWKEQCQRFQQTASESLEQLFAFDFAPNSPVVSFVIYQYFPFLSIDELDKAVSRFGPGADSCVYTEKMRERVRRHRLMAVGNMAPVFTLQDTAGREYHLSDFKGKIVLLDFTASWCHWCKVEIPYIEKVHKEIDGEDLEIISVYLDKKREDWVNDVRKSAHPWICLSDVKAWKKGGMAYDYFVGGIPALIVIDRDGRIVSKGTRGEETLEVIQNLKKKEV